MRRQELFPGPYSLTRLLQRQQLGELDRLIKNRLHASRGLIDRIELEADLIGHTGCVNCLEWNETGGLLASGSDDLHILFWDPFRHRIVQDLVTPHTGNIFSVKFMPQTSSAVVLSGAADGKIFAYDRNCPEQPLLKCTCHAGRIKRLATVADTPNLFWSAAEDGNVFQLDLREQHTCCYETTKLALVSLTNHISGAEVKCIATNPRRTELLAIGANDSFARLYDRRAMSVNAFRLRSFDDHVRNELLYQFKDDQFPKGCIAYFCPGHMQFSPTAAQSGAATYLTFSPDGRELLVNMGSEQIYLYDIYKTQETKIFELPSFVADEGAAKANKRPNLMIPDDVEKMKRLGNDLLDHEKFTEAINQYSKAILESPTPYPALFLNRATAFMKRKWRGDSYAALLDCKAALKLDPSYVKAHFRMARALLELSFLHEANDCLDEMRRRFPDYVNNHGVMILNRDIEQALENKKREDAGVNATNSRLMEQVSGKEQFWRQQAKDFKERFVGSVNAKTDIKEANFFGSDGKYIVAG